MPKAATIQTNFSGGELSPFLYGRVDVSKYNNGAAVLENCHPIIQGGAVSRPGTRHLGSALGDGFLVPFVYSRGIAYQVELTDGHLRIWSQDGALVPGIDFVAPWDLSQLLDVTYEQAEDTMFFFHVEVPTYRLQRHSPTSWSFEPLPYVTAPYAEGIALTSTIDVTLSAATVGTGRTLTAAITSFLPGDVGREFSDGLGGIATITGYTSGTVVTATIEVAFASTLVSNWRMSGTPTAFVFPNHKDPVGTSTTVYGSLPRSANITLSATTGAIDVTADAGIFSGADTGKILYAGAGFATLTFDTATHCTATVGQDFLSTIFQAGAYGITGDVFRPADVGAFIEANGGLFEITANAGTSVTATIIQPSTARVTAPPYAWTLKHAIFNSSAGYPRCGALHEQRLILAAPEVAPDTVYASRIGEYLNFETGLEDADGFSYKLSQKQRNPIRHLVSGKRLFAFTEGGEASIRGGNEKAIGPTNVQKDNESTFGTSGVSPVVIAKEVLFVQGAGRKLRAFGFSAAIDGFDSPDRTVFAEHVTESGLRDLAYQAEPFSLLYAVRNDGQLAVCAYDVGQEVIAWSRWRSGLDDDPPAQFRSVSVIPNYTSDDVWTLVRRVDADGFWAYYIERFEPGLCTDSATTFAIEYPGPTIDQLSGLSRHNGKTLALKIEGVYDGTAVVAGGIVEFTPGVEGEVGLPFVPTIEMLPPEIGSGSGTAQGSNLSVHEVSVRLLDTATLEVNGEESDFREFGSELLDQPPPGFTGDYRVIKLADDFIRDTLVIRQPKPFPMHVQAIIRKLTVNDV